LWLTGRTFHVAFDAIKAINYMKSGGAMDGAFSHSPQTVRDAAEKAEKAEKENAAAQTASMETTTPRQSGGLWNSKVQ
jgi:hypothetical protein